MSPFGYKGNELEYLIVQKKRELYCLNTHTFEKTIIDILPKKNGMKYTGMCTYAEDGQAKLSVTVDYNKFMLYTYKPPEQTGDNA